MLEVLDKLYSLLLRSPYFIGQLMLSAILSVGCALFVIGTLDQIRGVLGTSLTRWGIFEVVMLAAVIAMTFMLGLLTFLFTKSSILGTMKSANEIVEEAGEVAASARRLVSRKSAPVEASKGGLSLDVPSGAEGMLSQATYDAHGLEVALEVSDEADGVALDFDEEVVAVVEEHEAGRHA